jgi:hypothetical protein
VVTEGNSRAAVGPVGAVKTMRYGHLLLMLSLTLGCSRSGEPDEAPAPPGPAVCAGRSALRNAYFGDLHVHTSYSIDANAFQVRGTPADAYRFARGERIELPPYDAEGKATRSLTLDRPLDFAAVTDHSEYLGEIEACTTPGAEGYESDTCVQFRKGEYVATNKFGFPLILPSPSRFPDLCGETGEACRERGKQVWERVIEAADKANDRSAACAFTAFVAYEYTGVTGASNRHRNVIFKSSKVPAPTTYFEQPTAQGLWRELASNCRSEDGCEVLAIPHNPNESNGHMFAPEYPGATTPDEERAQAELRATSEPLVEIYQHKGESECMNGLSGVFGPADEQCGFEKHERPNMPDCGEGTGTQGIVNGGCYSRRDFVRGALLTGLKEEERLGVNPLRLGIIASTDTHNGTPGATDEDRFLGHRGTDDDTPAKRLGNGVLTAGGVAYGAGGLVGVWSEENSRESIFEALKRREVFGTSGPRIAVRFFGGWSYPAALCADPELLQKAYDGGTPMGGALGPKGEATAPTFLLWAQKDAGSSRKPGTPLQKAQIIKGWIENGEERQAVFDVAQSGTEASVDTATCEAKGAGADTLCGVWQDPSFSPGQRTFYYARVIENPTCRWSTYECNALAPADRPAICDDPAVPKSVQERAWASPIWYSP